MPHGNSHGIMKQVSVDALATNLYLPSLATSSLQSFYDDVVYWEIAKNTNKFFVTFERGNYAIQNNKQESIATMEIHHPHTLNNNSAPFNASSSVGGTRNNIPFDSFFQTDDEVEVPYNNHSNDGMFTYTEIKGTRYWESTITESISKSVTYKYQCSGSGTITKTREFLASYFYPFSSYQLSVLRDSPTLIIDLDKASELPSYDGIRGFAAIPLQTHTKIKDNLEYYLEKAGLIDKTTKTKMPKKGI